MKRLLPLLFWLLAAPAFGQVYTPPPHDAQFGLNALPCTNTSTTPQLVNWVDGHGTTHRAFCTPSGHIVAFYRGWFGIDLNLIGSQDENSTTIATYATGVSGKYGSGNTAQWAISQVNLMESFGGNGLFTYTNNNALPPNNSVDAPYMIFEITSVYSLINKLGWGTGPVKEIYALLSPQWGGFTRNANVDGLADYRDPNWAGMVSGVLVNSTPSTQVASAATAIKNLLFGISFDDSDTTHCFGASKDFTTSPVAGNNDFSCGYMVYFLAPMQRANSVQTGPNTTALYPDGTVYFKKRWHDLMVTEYTTIGNMNTAIGSSYSSFGTSGACVGTHTPAYITPCGSTAAADSLGTGDGTTLTFSGTLSHTAISGLSFGVFVGGVLVGGDPSTGAKTGGCGGTIFGPTLTSSTLNCSTGAWSITFTGGNAPGAGVAITGEYIANGWGQGGTGLLDEDCRAGHSSYCGNGSASTTINLTGLNAQAILDINAYTQDIAQFYSSTINSTLQTWAGTHGFTGHVNYLGPTTLGTWRTIPNDPVIAGFCGNIDAWMYGGAGGPLPQAQLDRVKSVCPSPDMAIIAGEYNTEGQVSEQAWPNSTATGVVNGNPVTVTVTVQTPNRLVASGTAVLYDIVCADSTYNRNNFHPGGITATTFTYTSSAGLATSSTSGCNFWPDDTQVGGYPTKAAMGAAYVTDATSLFNLKYTADNVAPFVAVISWQWYCDWSDKHCWGPITHRGNPNNNVDTVNGVVGCRAPDNAFNCGGELNVHNPPYGDVISSFISAHTTIDNQFLFTGVTGGSTIGGKTKSANSVFQ